MCTYLLYAAKHAVFLAVNLPFLKLDFYECLLCGKQSVDLIYFGFLGKGMGVPIYKVQKRNLRGMRTGFLPFSDQVQVKKKVLKQVFSYTHFLNFEIVKLNGSRHSFVKRIATQHFVDIHL